MTTELLAHSATFFDNIADDMLDGAKEIAAYTGDDVRRVNHLLETGRLPAFKMGKRWRMRKSTYLRYIEKLEAEALAAA